MVTVPGFLLRQLYVKGSLRNTEEGFAFALRNRLGSGYARRMLPLRVDGEEVPLSACAFRVEGGEEEVPFEAVTPERPFTLALNRTVEVRVRGRRLEPGAHRVEMGFEVQGFGPLRFDFTDTVEG